MIQKRLLATLLVVKFLAFMANAQIPQPILRLNTDMHSSMISRISNDAQGKYVLTCSYDKTAKLWKATTGVLIRTLRPPIDLGNEGMLYSCALSPGGDIAAVGWGNSSFNNCYIYIFNVSTGEVIQRIQGIESLILDLEFSPDGRYLAAALGKTMGVMIYRRPVDSSLFELLTHLEDYKNAILKICFDHSGRLAVASFEGCLRLYDSAFNRTREIHTPVNAHPISVAFSPDGSKLAVGYIDSPYIEVYDGVNLGLLYKPNLAGADSSDNNLSMVSFSSDGRYLFGAGQHRLKKEEVWYQIRRWDKEGKGPFTDFNACRNTVLDLKAMPDNTIIYCGARPDFGRMRVDGTLQFYKDPETNDYDEPDLTHLKVNYAGDKIEFKPVDNSVLYFSTVNKQLTTNPSGFNKLSSYRDSLDGIKVEDWKNNESPKINDEKLNFLQPVERSICVDISGDTGSVVFGTYWGIYCLNRRGGKTWSVSTQVTTLAVKVAGNNRTVIAAMNDGTIRWYRMSDGALLLTLFAHPDNKRWVLYTANGYYVCSKGGDELIGWHINDGADKAASFYPAKNFADKFFRPDLVSGILQKCETDLEILKSRGEEKTDISKKPPLVKITSPENNSISNTGHITISVDVTDQGGGIDEVLLYLNGKLVETTHRGVTLFVGDESNNTKTFDLTLTGGENRIKATAFNNSRTEAIADEISVTCQAAKATSNLYLLLIGIDKYKNPKYKLNYAVADATSIEQEMKKGVKDIFGKVDATLIQDDAVTRTSILAKFEELKAKVKPEDVFVFYYSGHGVMSEDVKPQFYIVPFDVTQLVNSNSEMQKVAISATELQTFSRDLKAQKQLYVFDACQSGGLVELMTSRGDAEERAIAQLARSTGTYWIAASGSQQFATEFSTLGHGLFTYTILKGLQGEADGNNDKKITVEELSTYIKNKLPEFSEKYKGEAQYPISFGYGMDFPISILK
jgi:WD40 repeat protein